MRSVSSKEFMSAIKKTPRVCLWSISTESAVGGRGAMVDADTYKIAGLLFGRVERTRSFEKNLYFLA